MPLLEKQSDLIWHTHYIHAENRPFVLFLCKREDIYGR
jgi:hypothetical protein